MTLDANRRVIKRGQIGRQGKILTRVNFLKFKNTINFQANPSDFEISKPRAHFGSGSLSGGEPYRFCTFINLNNNFGTLCIRSLVCNVFI